MDAPTYSLNQKWSVKKSIYGNFHSLFYVSILVPFVLFPAGFFLFVLFSCHLNMELFIARNRNDGLSVDNQVISVFGVNVVHVWKDTVLV